MLHITNREDLRFRIYDLRHKPNAKIVNRISALCAFVLICLSSVVSCGQAQAALRPAVPISMAEYVEMNVPHAGAGESLFSATLEVAPVELDMKLRTDYNPDNALRKDFPTEIREGAIAYFNRAGIFIAAKPDSGELNLKLRIISYEADRGANPEMLKVLLELALTEKKDYKTLLFGKAGSQVIIPIKELHKLMELTPPGGGKGIVVQKGSFELAKILLRTYEIIAGQIKANEGLIRKSLPPAGG